MKKTTKIICLALSFCMCVALGVIGVLAVQSINLEIGGNISFNAQGVKATVKLIETNPIVGLTGTNGKFADFEIDTSKTDSELQSEFASTWSGLSLGFDPNAATKGSGSITLRITNKDTAPLLVTNVAIPGVIKNASMTISDPQAIQPSGYADFKISFAVTDTSVDASLIGFNAKFNLSRYTDEIKEYNHSDYSSFAFTLDETIKTASIGGMQISTGESVTIPAVVSKTVSGVKTLYTVTDTGGITFAMNTTLRHVTLPSTLRVISNHTFNGCSNLQEIVIPESVVEIRGQSFYDCVNLGSLTMSEGVKFIESDAFDGCSKLTEFIIPDSVISIGEGIEPLVGSSGKVTKLVIGRNLSECGYGSFGFGTLTEVYIRSAYVYEYYTSLDDTSDYGYLLTRNNLETIKVLASVHEEYEAKYGEDSHPTLSASDTVTDGYYTMTIKSA